MTRLKGDCDPYYGSLDKKKASKGVGEHDPIKRGLRQELLYAYHFFHIYHVGEHDPIKRGLRPLRLSLFSYLSPHFVGEHDPIKRGLRP